MTVTSELREVLEATMKRILPSDGVAGASEANVMGYIDALFNRPEGKKYLPQIEGGLELLDSLAVSNWGQPFTACTPAEQDVVLSRLEAIPHRSAQRFFRMLIHLCLSGFLCDPRHGGNKGRAGWNHIGFNLRVPEV